MSVVRGALVKFGIRAYDKIKRTKKASELLQRNVLKKLLNRASSTAFGQQYQFDSITKSTDFIKVFQETVPLHDYDKIFDEWWHRLLRGEANICWPGKVAYFGLSSGTAGDSSKYVPVTDDMLKSMRRASANVFRGSLKLNFPVSFYGRQFLFLGGCTKLKEENGLYFGDISGINTAIGVPSWLEDITKPGKAISDIENWDDRLQAIVKEAPKWDLCCICGIPSWLQLMIERIVAHYKIDTIHDIWPNLEVYVGGGISFDPYRKRFSQFTARSLRFIDTYYTSEGYLACQQNFNSQQSPMKLFLNNGLFFEFIPFDDNNFPNGSLAEQATCLTIGEIEENVDYALVLSTCAGAWRYRIGDTIRFVNKETAEIVITGRTKHFLNVCGEHLSVDNMNQGILRLEQFFGASMPEFTVKAVGIGNHFEHHWYIGCDKLNLNEKKVAEKLDQFLAELNDDYQTERRDNLLRSIQVKLLPLSTFFDWQAGQGKLGGQNKFPRVMRDELFEDWKAFLTTKGLI